MPPRAEPSLRRAAALLLHWGATDIEGVVICLSELTTLDEAMDVITMLLLLSGKSREELFQLIRRESLREAAA